MRVAVVGAGYWGRKHVQEYAEMGCEVTVCDPDPRRGRYCKRRFGAGTKPLGEVLADDGIKHVSICAPNALHHELGMRAARAGKHLLVEKPLCATSAQAARLHRLARKKGTKLLCGHIFRFNNAVEKARQVMASGRLGDVLQVKCFWHQRLDFVRDRNILLDIGLHPVDIVHYWLGHVPARAACIPHAFEKEYAESAFFDYAAAHEGSKINVSVDLNWISHMRRRDVIVLGTRRTMVLAAVDQTLTVHDGRGRASSVRLKKNNTLRDQLSYFVSQDAGSIEGGQKGNGRVAVQVMRTLERADGARLTGRHA